MKKFNKKFLVTTLIFTLLFVIFNQVKYRLPFLETIMNSFFWLGFCYMIIGAYAIVDILGLFKSFSYLFYRRKVKAANKSRLKDGEEPEPMLDLYGFMQTKETASTKILVKIFLTCIFFYGVSFLISLRYIQ